ncbi:hypothetical protein XHV734_3984 [Xanthomonas hortorum pv. vitians]|nr:hypothetical protein XHV734_3984 [Xanthomonas hortorum pv. vitians]
MPGNLNGYVGDNVAIFFLWRSQGDACDAVAEQRCNACSESAVPVRIRRLTPSRSDKLTGEHAA